MSNRASICNDDAREGGYIYRQIKKRPLRVRKSYRGFDLGLVEVGGGWWYVLVLAKSGVGRMERRMSESKAS